jgi:DNA-binding GntR family transcriptional regulator
MPSTIRTRPRRVTSKSAGVSYGELPDRIYTQLRDQIIRGRLAPGTRLVEGDLAQRFAVSRTPVREALVRLERESYVVTGSEDRRTRFLVAPLSPESVPEIWGVMGAMEGQAILAIESMDDDARRALTDELELLNGELKTAAAGRPRDIDLVGDLMSAFHVSFMKRCAGPWLIALYDSVRPHVQRYEWAYGAQSDTAFDSSVDEHRKIIAAVAAADPVLARKRIEQHWASGAERTVSLIRRLGAKSPASR